MKKFILGASVISLIAMPIAASAAPVNANPARSLSVSPSVRTAAATSKSSKLAGGASIVPILIGAGIIAGVTYLIVDHEDDKSDSN